MILLDVRLPKMDGFEVAAAIRSLERLRRTPIIFMSANEDRRTQPRPGTPRGLLPQAARARSGALDTHLDPGHPLRGWNSALPRGIRPKEAMQRRILHSRSRCSTSCTSTRRRDFLADAVAEYLGDGPARRRSRRSDRQARASRRLPRRRRLGAVDEGRLQTPRRRGNAGERLMADGMPQWKAFHEVVGGLIGELCAALPRRCAPTARWSTCSGSEASATRRSGSRRYWNELGRLQTFSLFCAYRMDPLDSDAYGGPLECVCNTHTHLIPARDPRASTRR